MCVFVCVQVRAFDSDEVVHVDDSVDPVRDLDTIQVSGCYIPTPNTLTLGHPMQDLCTIQVLGATLANL